MRRLAVVSRAARVVSSLSIAAIACGSSPDARDPAPPGAPRSAPEPGSPVRLTSPPRRPVLPPVAVDLGAVEAFAEVVLDVPPGALGFNVVVQTELEGARIGILRITSPSGECVHDRYIPKGGSHATSLSPFTSIAAAGVPQGQGRSVRPIEPGPWRIVFADGRFLRPDGRAPEPLPGQIVPPMSARAVIQRGADPGGAFVGARLDLVVHVPDGLLVDERALDAGSAGEDPSISERLSVFYAGLRELFDVDRGDVRFEPAPAILRSLDARTLEDAFAVPEGEPADQALHVVLANDVMIGLGASAWGAAPGVPGAAVLSGTAMSAVVLVVGATEPVLDGLVLLHEAGHFLGLGHTSELDGEHADPLADTPRCPSLSGADPATAEACPDRTNLMFPTYSSTWAAHLEVSDAQRAVVHGSPVLRVYADGAPPGPAARAAAFTPPPGGRRASDGLRVLCTYTGLVRRRW